MTTNAITKQDATQLLENVVVGGDLSKLSAADRLKYYQQVCHSLGLNPFTKPFDYITLNNKLTLYARRDCTDQLRKIHGISVSIVSRELTEGVYVVTARATDTHGRSDESIGAVPLDNLKGEARANALMKCETKAKRRVTLSICGLGMLDESEAPSVAGAQVVNINDDGEIMEQPRPADSRPSKITRELDRFLKATEALGWDDRGREEWLRDKTRKSWGQLTADEKREAAEKVEAILNDADARVQREHAAEQPDGESASEIPF